MFVVVILLLLLVVVVVVVVTANSKFSAAYVHELALGDPHYLHY